MPKLLRVVFDSTVLVSAFLAEKQLSAKLLRHARQGAFILCSADLILAETRRVLLESPHIRRRYEFRDERVHDYIQGLRFVARLSADFPAVKGISRDPQDDMVLACGLAAQAHYLITRDKDLLSLDEYEGIGITSPEKFMALLRRTHDQQ
jgi:putative PIN family toxin of toxin-antitoxin system